jgi:hypothetical protein
MDKMLEHITSAIFYKDTLYSIRKIYPNWIFLSICLDREIVSELSELVIKEIVHIRSGGCFRRGAEGLWFVLVACSPREGQML